jgi:hypothetical protein
MREGEVGRKSLGQWDFKADIEDTIAQVVMYTQRVACSDCSYRKCQ